MAILDIEDVKKSLEFLSNKNNELLARYPISIYIGLLDDYPIISEYGYISPGVIELLSSIDNLEYYKLSVYHKILLLNLIIIRLSECSNNNSSKNIILIYDLKRIYLDVISSGANESEFIYASDKFHKNLAVCLKRLQPLGAQKICFSSIPRNFLFKNNISQFFRGAFSLVVKTKGFRPVYEMHTDSNDPALLEQFSSDGWVLFYKCIAEELMLNTSVKALYGISWFFDPCLKGISPRLSYLLELPLAHGAELFFIGPSDSARKSALATSNTRSKMYLTGKYEPTDYMLVWGRADILRWYNSLNEMEIMNAK
jgi:hypothetical protein